MKGMKMSGKGVKSARSKPSPQSAKPTIGVRSGAGYGGKGKGNMSCHGGGESLRRQSGRDGR